MPTVRLYRWHAVRRAYAAGLQFDQHEQRRRSRLRFSTLTERFDQAHYGLRIALADATGRDAADLRFSYSALGKPSLLSETPEPLHFSLSHAGQHIMLAVAACPVGLDLEAHQATAEVMQQLVPYVMQTAEQTRLHSMSDTDKIKQFYRHWVAKEALMKHTGLGLQLPPQAIFIREDFQSAEVAPAWEYQLGTDWCIQEIPAAEGYSAALCTAQPVRVQCCEAEGLLKACRNDDTVCADNALWQPENTPNADFSMAIRLSSAESLALRKV
ncbi:4'-phosphopantetheinyl transferase family protein [Undibacterium squillarum]|uniref:4'-phosphopantetheinyl transferase domain-containing protein n=1 Tax=Undibacterium squillarum TaxID=1131567 RepID=A0ABQ2XQN2_9BURK|nr:4'-phosphopantetheinyl transferase superfamily protein [Undibacterium squillarum]GGX29498.1 hypothetical protein GCM10010946_03050 [Undibacterium squillarum]